MVNFELTNLIAFGFGTYEVLIFAIVLLVLFGGAKLPTLMRNLGRSVNEFKAGIKEKPEVPPRVDDNPDEPAIEN